MRFFLPFFLLLASAAALTGCTTQNASHSASEAATAADPFQDVTREVGIDFRCAPAKRPMRILESVGSGCGFVDYDSNGKLDVFVVGNPRCALYRNDGGRFTDVTARAGLDLPGPWITFAVGDYDRDGHPDLVLAGYRKVALFHNRGDGTFEDRTARAGIALNKWCNTAAFADLDNDGYPDLYIGTYVKFGPESKQYCSLHENGARTSCRPLDYDPEIGNCFRNQGDGTFEDVTRRWGLDQAHGKNLGIALADFNRDGWTDICLANDEMPQDLLQNLGGKGFRNVGVETGTAFAEGERVGGMGVDWGDIDGDGWPDLLIGTFENEPKALFRNLGGKGFEWVSGSSQLLSPTHPWVVFGALLFDYDNDGRPDAMFANGHVFDNVEVVEPTSRFKQPTQLLRNENGRFVPVVSKTLDVPMAGRGLACGDYDNDGRLDILVSDLDGPVRLLRNAAGGGGHWLALSLTGTKSNRDGYGARVSVTAGGVTRAAESWSARSYASACDPRVHFGLGAAARAERVEIRWPSGAVTTRTDVPADQVLQITEGS